jgi:capsular exopolysaccharide synthesis family protein
MEQSNNSIKDLNIKDEILKYLPFWYWILLGVIVSLFSAYIYLRYENNVYQTQAKIKILDNSNAAFKLPTDAVSIFGRGKVNLENEMEVIKSARIVSQVVDKLNLTTSIYSLGKIKTTELWKDMPFDVVWATDLETLKDKSFSFKVEVNEKGFKMSESGEQFQFGQTNFKAVVPFKIILKEKGNFKNLIGSNYQISLYKHEDVVKNLANSIAIDYVGKQSEILSVSLNGENPEKIEVIVNTLIDIFDLDGIKDRQIVSQKTIDFVNDRFTYLFNELDSIEGKKSSYKRSNEISFLEGDAGALLQTKYESQSELVKANTQIALAGLMTTAINKSNKLEVLPANIGIENIEVNGLVASYNEIILKRDKLLSSAGESNPMVAALTQTAQQIKENIKSSIKGFQNALQVNRNQLSQITAQESAKYSTVPEKEKAIRSIERQQNIKETLYILLLQKREEAAINLAITNPSIKIIDFAIVNDTPISPKRQMVYLIAFLLGLLVPVGIIFVYYLFDTKVHTKADVVALVPSIPVIAEIPYIASENKMVRFLDRSVLSEAFRILRTNINFIVPIKENKEGSVLFVTSTVKGEGKTFVSLNTAITLSTLNKKVILVGADLRNPQLHKQLNLERTGYKGVANYLHDTVVSIEDLKVKDVSNNLKFDIIFSGTIPPNPSELLSNGRFELLLNELKKEYDYVIVDTAPTLLVTDTTLITHLADAILYVTRANFTDRKLFTFISELKHLNNIQNIGIILNNVGDNKGYGYGYSYRYSYNYGYGYGYSSDDNKYNLSWGHKMKKYFRNLRK